MRLLHSIPKSLKKNHGWPWDEVDVPGIEKDDDSIWLSVIIPSYNQGKFIEEAIRSVLAQGVPGIELIVMDGGSKDETTDVLKHYDEFLIWRSEKDRGQSHAMNKGLHMAKGTYIGFLNSDDFYERGALASIFLEAGKNHSAPSILLGKTRLIKATGEQIRVNTPCTKFYELAQPGHRKKMPNNPSGYVYHRQMHEQIGDFDEDDHFTMDYDFLLKGYRAAKDIIFKDEIWGNYRYDDHTKTFQQEQSGDPGMEKLKNKQALAVKQAAYFGEKYLKLIQRAHALYSWKIKITAPRFMRWLADPINRYSRLTIDRQLAQMEKSR